MNQTTVLDTPASEVPELEVPVPELQAGIAQCLTEIDQMREQMARDQAEIDRSRRRTHALLADLRATLSPAGRKAA